MKRIIAVIALVYAVSHSAFAATELRHSDMSRNHKIGNVSAEVIDGTIDDVMQKLSKKTDKAGAAYFRVTSMGTVGMGDTMRGTAEIYN
ncbi:DUF1471 domain-containing protein [Salmonella enterica]|nr:DUF1471 domain-containing protein [Salmonella enterica]